jgi:Lon protease-like protein
MTTLPLFPLGLVLFPDGPLGLRIFEPRYVDMVKRCMREASPFGVVLIRQGQEAGAETPRIETTGTSAEIVDFHQLPDGLLGLSCVGRRRFRVLAHRRQADGLNIGEIEWLAPEPLEPVPARLEPLAELLRSVLPELGGPYAKMTARLDDAAWVGHRLVEILPIPLADKQLYLELDDPIARLEGLAELAPRA